MQVDIGMRPGMEEMFTGHLLNIFVSKEAE